MCNLSKGIENRGEAKGVLKTLIQLVQDGDLSQIELPKKPE